MSSITETLTRWNLITLMGPGPWYWGREDGTGGFMVYRRGYETREEALNVMEDVRVC